MIEYLMAGLLGWAAGALVNYLADVLPLRRRLTDPFCLECEETQPIINYLVWPRRCEVCGKNRSWRVWIVELAAIAATVWLWIMPPARFGFFPGLILLVYFGVVVVIDIEYRLIMHPVSLVGAGLGLIYGVGLHGWYSTLEGGAVGFALMLLLYFFGVIVMRLLAKWKGKDFEDEALGFGDVNLSGILGLLLGYPGILAGLTLTIFLGGAASLIYLLVVILRKRYRSFIAIPYGPFLIAGAFFLLYIQ